MSEWGDQPEPEWERVRRGLGSAWDCQPIEPNDYPKIRVGANWLRLGVSLAAIAVTWLAAVNVYDGFLAAWEGGALVLGAGAACWAVEVLT